MSSHHSTPSVVVIEIRNGDSNSDSDAVIIIHHADRAASAANAAAVGELPRRQRGDQIENRIKEGEGDWTEKSWSLDKLSSRLL